MIRAIAPHGWRRRRARRAVHPQCQHEGPKDDVPLARHSCRSVGRTRRRAATAGHHRHGRSHHRRPMACCGQAMGEPVHRTLLAAAVGTIVFVLLAPGPALVLVTYLLTGWRLGPPLLGWSATRWVGAA